MQRETGSEQQTMSWGVPRDEQSMLEYIADSWERRVNRDRRRVPIVEEPTVDERRLLPLGRRFVDLDSVIDQAEKRLRDAKRRLAVLREYQQYLSTRIGNGECDDTLRYTEAFFNHHVTAVSFGQVTSLLGLLEARCDCEALEALRPVLGDGKMN